MTKRRPLLHLHASVRRHFWSGLKFLAATSAVICLFVVLQFSDSPSKLDYAASHLSASYTSAPFDGVPKVAFLFLARTNVPLDFLWHAFFQNGDQERFSIYVHSSPGFVFDKTTTRSHYFYGRQLKHSIQVVWGEASMIEAEKLLLKSALENPANQRFILLSDSCIPLYNFSHIYDYVISSSKSFVDSFIDAKDQRYNPKMSPTVSKGKWRKGSQWTTLTRKHAVVVASDVAIFTVFKKHCKRISEHVVGKKQNVGISTQKQHDCIPDEHYVQTLLSMHSLDHELERRTLTYTTWRQIQDKMNKQGWHPLTFEFADTSPRRIREIKNINHVYYETEFRTEWCQSNGRFMPCFLFARKFSKGAAMRLLNDRMFGAFDATKLLYNQLNAAATPH